MKELTSLKKHTKSKSYDYSDGYMIEIKPGNKVNIHFQGDVLEYDEEDKPLFDYGTGETVIEYSGLAVDGNKQRSWAIARYSPNAHAPLHYHEHLTEDYYIVKGCAKVMIDGEPLVINTGEHIQISPGQQHQVLNVSEELELVLIVKCCPSWYKDDYNLDKTDSTNTNTISFSK